jgi:uncharacterized protein (TIGR01440 family)
VNTDGLTEQVRQQMKAAARQLIDITQPEPHDVFVLGCSTSELAGHKIGSSSSAELAAAAVNPVLTLAREHELYLAVQCCEHLNRVLVVPAAACAEYRLCEVSAVPQLSAGGACAAWAYEKLRQPVLVETLEGHLGLDVGSTLIGMHLRPVVVPVRLASDQIGQAHMVAARTRPKLIGGRRAEYPKDPIKKGPGKKA